MGTSGSATSKPFESIIQAEQAIGREYEREAELGRLAHLRVAGAYSRKIREVQTLLDHLPAPVFLKDAAFRYATVNRAFSEAAGKPTREIVSKSDYDLFPSDLVGTLECQDRDVTESRSANSCHRIAWGSQRSRADGRVRAHVQWSYPVTGSCL